MTFFRKPAWYGNPVLTKKNLFRYLRSIVILFALSLVLASISTLLLIDGDGRTLELFLGVLFMFPFIVIFVTGLMLAFFFWSRAFVNFLATARCRTKAFEFWSLRMLYVPLYGWRNEDLTEAGMNYRRLAIEGLVGFLGSVLSILGFALLGKLVGLDIFAS